MATFIRTQDYNVLTENQIRVWRDWNTSYTTASITGANYINQPRWDTGTFAANTYTIQTQVWNTWVADTRVAFEDLTDVTVSITDRMLDVAARLRQTVEVNGGQVIEEGWEETNFDHYDRIKFRVWNRWAETAHTVHPDHWYDRRVETDEERQARLDREQQQREALNRERLAREKRREGAVARARELLLMILSEEEREMYERTQEVHVRGSEGNLYIIQMGVGSGVHGNIKQVDEHGCVLGRACVSPSMRAEGGALPVEDGWAGQYLGIKFNEREFMAHANWSGRAGCQNPEVETLRGRRLRRRQAA